MENRHTGRTIRAIAVGVVLVFGLLLGSLGYFSLDKHPPTVSKVDWAPEVQWMSDRTAGYGFYTRSQFFLPGPVQGAWLRISAENNFSLYVNGRLVAAENFQRAFKLSKAVNIGNSNQSLDDDSAYLALNPPMFLANSDDWKITFYSDLAPYLVPGRNVIALAIHSSQQDARVAVEGKIYPTKTGAPVNITSGDASWQVSPVAINYQGTPWFDPDFGVEDWPTAKALGPVQEATYSRLSPHIFDRLLQGRWITGSETEQGEVALQKDWIISQPIKRAYVRFTGQEQSALFLNGHLIVPEHKTARELHTMEVSHYLHPGRNSLAVHLRRPLVAAAAVKTNSDYAPLAFYLDGWGEDAQNKIVDSVTTDDTWRAGFESTSGEPRQAATLLQSPVAHQFVKGFEGDAYIKNYPSMLMHRLLWSLGGSLLSLAVILGLGRIESTSPHNNWQNLVTGSALMLPGVFYLLGIVLLKHRYAEDEEILWFLQPHSFPLVICGFFGVVALTLAWTFRAKSSTSQSSDLPVNSASEKPLSSWLVWTMLVAILVMTFGLRIYGLEQAAFFADEGTTLDTARGILYNRGAPILTAGIWYTRSPAYHYLLAFWLGIWGDTGYAARTLSVVWGVATIAVVFFFTRRLTGKAWIALLVAALLALDPNEILGSRIVRFYQGTQCLTMLSFWLFYEGYILSQRKQSRHRFWFLLLLAATLLNLETSFILLPCFLAGFLYCYRRIQIKYDWPLLAITCVILMIFTYDMALFSWRCLTPPLAMSISTGSIVQPNLFDLSSFGISFISGAAARISILYSFFFILGCAYFTWQKRGDLFFLFSSIVIYVAELCFLIMQTRTRYFYIIYPIFIILAVYSAIAISSSLGKKLEASLAGRLPLKKICMVFVGLLLFANLKLGDVFQAYGDNITDRQIEMFEYIREHKAPEDIVVAFQPQAQLAAVTLDKLDYLLVNEPRFDHLYENADGQILDRWAGAIAIFNVDQFQQILENTKGRVWITASSADPDKKSNPLTPYSVNLGKTVFETYGGHLRLWEPNDGLIIRIPNRNGDVEAF